AVAIAVDRPHHVIGQPAGVVLSRDQAAPHQLEQAHRADPQRALAIDEQRARLVDRQAELGVEQLPAPAAADRAAALAAAEALAPRRDAHLAVDAARVLALAQALAEIGDPRAAARQRPQMMHRADPQHAVAIAEHAVDALAVLTAEPDLGADL